MKKAEAGAQTGDLARRHGISEAKRLRSLEDENAKLKRLLTDAILARAALKDLLTKNGDARRTPGSGSSFAGS